MVLLIGAPRMKIQATAFRYGRNKSTQMMRRMNAGGFGGVE
jgi:hypothetical protein